MCRLPGSCRAFGVLPGRRSRSPGARPPPRAPRPRRAAGLAITISVDTTLAEVARAALDAGAAVINDISAGRDDPAMLPLAASRNVPLALMHMQGTPKTMQDEPAYGDVIGEVLEFLRER